MNKQAPVSLSQAYQDTKYVYFDIETLPSDDAGMVERLAADVAAPSNYKDEEKIAAYKLDKAREQFEKTSFDGGRGSVACIAWAVGESDVRVEAVGLHGVTSEAFLVNEFLWSLPMSNVALVGHNIIGFDIPFLTKRAICLGVPLPPKHVWPRQPKPWADKIHDTMQMWDGRNMTGMDALCDMLGVTGKGDMDGSKVAGLWASGGQQEVADYCAADVERTRQIHQRFLAVGY